MPPKTPPVQKSAKIKPVQKSSDSQHCRRDNCGSGILNSGIINLQFGVEE